MAKMRNVCVAAEMKPVQMIDPAGTFRHDGTTEREYVTLPKNRADAITSLRLQFEIANSDLDVLSLDFVARAAEMKLARTLDASWSKRRKA